MATAKQYGNPAEVIAESALIAGRYERVELLGKGGMACVYKVVDRSTGREVALKQLQLDARPQQQAHIAAMFEHEFHTLAELNHPRVIAVYDYGLSATGPFYTMELLDGGDLRDRSPLPYREACALIFDVCSSLALMHSRRLLHRDVSPRNVRCTRDGKAKLIDFGAMRPMGGGSEQIVGTPAFTPPEVLQRCALDARTDLYSLGATLYYALTRRLPYAVHSFSELTAAWSTPLPPPSVHVAGIPEALDDLVMSLLDLEASQRPHNAFEVMQRLAAIAGLPCSEPEGVSRAYLAMPVLIGRENVLSATRARLKRALSGHGGGVVIRGQAGFGRSRMLDACSLQAKMLNATVLRASASDAQQSFAVALALAQHALDALPDAVMAERFSELLEQVSSVEASRDRGAHAQPLRLRATQDLARDPAVLERSLRDLVLHVSRHRPLLVAVDDVERIDEPSAAVLAALLDEAPRHALLVALTAEDEPQPASRAVEMLARRCGRLTLAPLTREQTRELLASVFGDVANLETVAAEIHDIAHGNPRACIDLAQHLADTGTAKYTAGAWTLPERLAATDLPRSAEAAIRARADALSPLARRLARAQALAFHEVFAHEDYHALCPDADAREIGAALSELLATQALSNHGRGYTLANRVWTGAVIADLSTSEREQYHRALASIYAGKSDAAVIHHCFAAGLAEQGFDALVARHTGYEQGFDLRRVIEMNAAGLGPSYARGIATGVALGRPARDVHELRRWAVALNAMVDVDDSANTAAAWLAQLTHDSGLSDWQADRDNPDAGDRLTRALTAAHARHQAMPEHERAYRVDEAIRMLAQYVACSIAIGGRQLDAGMIATLPPLLEPFAPLSPALAAIRQNAIATLEANVFCRSVPARARWLEVLAQLENVSGAELQHVAVIRNAVSYGIGMCEATIGLPTADSWAARIEHDPLQHVNALNLRKLVRLSQGDFAAAEQLRQQAERLALRDRTPQMFASLLLIELQIFGRARDLRGVKDALERIEQLAQRYPGWVPYRIVGEAIFQQIRGDLAAAHLGFEQCVAQTAFAQDELPRALPAWIMAQAGLAETLIALGRAREAYDHARAAAEICATLQVDVQAHPVRRQLALAEAALGDFAGAAARIDVLIAESTALGVSGLNLGLAYEARAQIALWAGEETTFEQFARLTAEQYRFGAQSPLGARCTRLLHEARRKGFASVAELAELEPTTMMASTDSEGGTDVTATRTRVRG